MPKPVHSVTTEVLNPSHIPMIPMKIAITSKTTAPNVTAIADSQNVMQ